MCGIAGVVSVGREPEDHRVKLERMNDAIAHRGPNDSGIFVESGVALGHRRLAIIDLSAAGHQPMQSADGRFVLVFNGEIYNFRELRPQLDYPFRSHSDSEVLLAAWQRWGRDCIDRLVGMFAFAVWDRELRELHLVRDRLGIKPLYYHLDSGQIIFASEVRAILASRMIPGKLNSAALTDYLRYQCVHHPQTIVEGVQSLAPGTHLRFAADGATARRYWSPLHPRELDDTSIRGVRKSVFDALLKAVERRLVADVPFGAFLSGGIDSSAIVALMSQVTDKVSTFSVTFAEKEFSEARYARVIAEKFRTSHHEIQLSPKDFLRLLPEALDRMDHPSGDGPNTYVVSKVTKDAGITMALSGLGGDELFAGYPIFRQCSRLARMQWLNWFPCRVRAAMGKVLQTVRPGIASTKIASVLGQPKVSALAAYPFYRQVFLDGQVRELLSAEYQHTHPAESVFGELFAAGDFESLPLLSRVSVAEMTTYMHDVLLRDTDQMSMAHALEVRVPFLDHELVELVLGIPDHIKYPHTPKQLLTDSLGDLLPAEIVNRPKMGFALPFVHWMKRELRGFCEERLQRLSTRPQFNGQTVQRYWSDFLTGNRAMSWSRVWSLVVLEHWLERNAVK